MRLFRQFILRHLVEERGRFLASMLGIALGIGVVVAIQMTNRSSIQGFETAIETVSGKTSLEIVGPGLGLDEKWLQELGWLRRYGAVTPVIEGDTLARISGSAETLHVLGVDILRDRAFRDYRLLAFAQKHREPRPQEFLALLMDPHAVVLTEKFARRHNLSAGTTIELTIGDRAQTFTIRGLLRDEGPARVMDGNFALMDIAAAQWAFHRLGRVDRIEVQLDPGISVDEAEVSIAERLPQALSVRRPARRGRQVEKLLEAFHFNLAALSYIALLVGLFLIYNAVSTSVIARREEIGTLRALGVTRFQVVKLFLAEACGLALVGSLLGLLLGRVLAQVAVALTSTTVKVLYIATSAEPPTLGWQHVVLAFSIGVPLSLVAAAAPAMEASRVTPTEAMRGADRLATRYRLHRRYLIVPFLLFGLAAWLSTQGPVGSLPIFGYAAAIAIVFGAAFLVPAVLHLLARVGIRPLARLFQIEGRLAHSNLAGTIPRLSISVAALAISLAMLVAIAIMIGSFRETLIYWVHQTLQADLYLRPATRNNVATEATLSPEVELAAAAHPSVAAVDRFRNFDLSYREGLITLGTGDFTVLLDHGKLLFKEPDDGRQKMREALGQDAVVVSESFALKQGKSPGGNITLPTPKGPATFRIAGVYYDYSNDRGVVVMDRPTFVQHFGEHPPTSLSIYLRPGANADTVREEILQTLGEDFRVRIFTNASLRGEVLRIFDSTFAITYALEAIAIFVAIMGVASTLLTLILERKREIAVLRLIGADRGQVQKMVIVEAALIGGVSQSIGITVGLMLSFVLIYVINVQSFGWTIQFHLPVWFLVQSSILIFLATTLSGIYPARLASQVHATEQGWGE